MFSMSSFADEYIKIAASKSKAHESGYQQTRQGKRPIRVHNLLKKASKAEAAKAVAEGAGGLKGMLGRMWNSKLLKPTALVGTGVAAGKAGEELLLEPWQYGRRAQEMGAQF